MDIVGPLSEWVNEKALFICVMTWLMIGFAVSQFHLDFYVEATPKPDTLLWVVFGALSIFWPSIVLYHALRLAKDEFQKLVDSINRENK